MSDNLVQVPVVGFGLLDVPRTPLDGDPPVVSLRTFRLPAGDRSEGQSLAYGAFIPLAWGEEVHVIARCCPCLDFPCRWAAAEDMTS